MIAATKLIDAIAKSLREVIAPAVVEPYPKSQAYMAAVILEFVSRQVAAGGDIDERKLTALQALYDDLSRLPQLSRLAVGGKAGEAELSELIERLYRERDLIGEETFTAANGRVRRALRQLIDEELKVAGKAEG
jgi:hypothetical protein